MMKNTPLILALLLVFSLTANAEDKFETNNSCVNATYETLLSGMENKSYQSLIKFIRCIDMHDGGNLNDLYIEANYFLERNPFLYGYILETEGVINFPSFKSFFYKNDPNNIDDFPAQEREFKQKLEYVQSIENDEIRKKAESVLETRISELRNAISDTEN